MSKPDRTNIVEPRHFEVTYAEHVTVVGVVGDVTHLVFTKRVPTIDHGEIEHLVCERLAVPTANLKAMASALLAGPQPRPENAVVAVVH